MVESVFRVLVIGILIAITIGIFGTIAFSWTLDTSPYLKGLANFLHVIYYVLPIGKLSPILFCFISLMVFRIVVSVIKTLWNLIPVRRIEVLMC